MMEIYRYRVVYPGGTFIRTTPHVDAQTTGEVLEFGVTFEACKSLFLDGINYVKLMDGRGWVFGRKGRTEVLQLLEVKRGVGSLDEGEKCCYVAEVCNSIDFGIHISESQGEKAPYSEEHNSDFGNILSPKAVVHATDAKRTLHKSQTSVKKAPLSSSKAQRGEQMYWKEVRARCKSCSTFDQFSLVCQLASSALQSPPPSIPEPGPARSAWMATAAKFSNNYDVRSLRSTEPSTLFHSLGAATVENPSLVSEQQVRTCISLIAALTHQVVVEGQLLSRSRSSTSTIASAMVGLEAHLWVLVNLRAGAAAHVMNLIVSSANATFERMTAGQRNIVIEQCLLPLATLTKQHCQLLGAKVGLLGDDIKHFIQRWVIIRLGSSVEAYDDVAERSISSEHLDATSEHEADKERYYPLHVLDKEETKICTSMSYSIAGLMSWLRNIPSSGKPSGEVLGGHLPAGSASPSSRNSVCGSDGSTDAASEGSSQSSRSRMSQFFNECDKEIRKFATNPEFQLAGMI